VRPMGGRVRVVVLQAMRVSDGAAGAGAQGEAGCIKHTRPQSLRPLACKRTGAAGPAVHQNPAHTSAGRRRAGERRPPWHTGLCVPL